MHTLLTLKVVKNDNIHNGYALTLYDNKVPQPSDIYDDGVYTLLTWRIEGTFNTPQNKEYFNDIKEKLMLLIDAYDAKSKHLLRNITSSKDAFVALHNKYSKHQNIVTLRDFSDMEDLRVRSTSTRFTKYMKSTMFKRVQLVALNLAAEGILTEARLDEFICEHSKNYKQESYMAHEVYKWVKHKIEIGEFYTPKKKKLITRTREDNAIIQSRVKFENNYRQFKMYMDFIKNGLEMSVSKLSKILGFSRPTIYKFIKIYVNLKSVKFISVIGGVLRDGLYSAPETILKQGTKVKSKLSELISKIPTMSMGDLIQLRENVTVSEADIHEKIVILQLIRERTHPEPVETVEYSEIKQDDIV